jgi:hypothetical protein
VSCASATFGCFSFLLSVLGPLRIAAAFVLRTEESLGSLALFVEIPLPFWMVVESGIRVVFFEDLASIVSVLASFGAFDFLAAINPASSVATTLLSVLESKLFFYSLHTLAFLWKLFKYHTLGPLHGFFVRYLTY